MSETFVSAAAPAVSVIVPVRNEADNIAPLVDEIAAALAKDVDFELIYVNDGSSDRTAAIVRETYAGVERVKVHRKENGGKSAALNFGITRTEGYEVIVESTRKALEGIESRRSYVND